LDRGSQMDLWSLMNLKDQLGLKRQLRQPDL
jgi:hypothetical protein